MKRCIYCMTALSGKAEFCPQCGRNQQHISEPHVLMPGTILKNRYITGICIGEGGFGITYAGWDSLLNERVAIKEFFPREYAKRDSREDNKISFACDSGKKTALKNSRKNFEKEAVIIREFSDEECIVNLWDSFKGNNTSYNVMKYFDGKTVKDCLRDGGVMRPVYAVKLLIPLIRAISVIHGKGFIHRDITPDNILISDGRAVLLDFGSAADIYEDKTERLPVLIKRGFAPCEQYGNSLKQGPWTDIYSLCATLYVCITGEIPGGALNETDYSGIKKPSEFGINISKDLEAVILKGLSFNSEDRYQSADELLYELDKALKSEKTKSESIKNTGISSFNSITGEIKNGQGNEKESVYNPATESGPPINFTDIIC